jgi:perosamine synthetase
MQINQIEPWLDYKEKNAVMEYLNSDGWLTEFKKTKELEEMIAKYVGSDYCCMVMNGTVSLFCALVAYGIGKRDEVICPDYTMIATANAITLSGAKPVFVDVYRDSMCIDLQQLIDKTTKKTKAIMLVSINGRYADNIDAIIDYCTGHDIVVIEDAAQSLGSFSDSVHVGTLGDVGSFSFSMPKIITTGQGGCLVTNNKEIDENIRMIKDFGRPKSGVDQHEILGWNFKFTDLQAVIGIEQMKKLPERVEKKKNIYKWYQKYLEGEKGIEFIKTDEGVAPWFIDVFVDNREAMIAKLKEKGIGTRPFYPAIHTQKPYNWVKGKFPNSEWVSQHGLWLPSSSFLTEEHVKYICGSMTH